MHVKDQQLLEEAYAKTKALKLGQDEESFYVAQFANLGDKERTLKNRFYALYDSNGKEIPRTTPLKRGQILNRTTDWGVFFEVQEDEEGFIATPFQPTQEVRSNIDSQKNIRVSKQKDRALRHFFHKK